MANVRIKNFDRPTQVKFYDIDSYIGGIGYVDYIICGCCGSIIDIEEIYELAPEGVEPIIPMKWIDISNEIVGE